MVDASIWTLPGQVESHMILPGRLAQAEIKTLDVL